MLSNDLLAGCPAAAAFLGITPRSVYHMVEKGQVPCIRKGKRLYFRKSELESAFQSGAA